MPRKYTTRKTTYRPPRPVVPRPIKGSTHNERIKKRIKQNFLEEKVRNKLNYLTR